MRLTQTLYDAIATQNCFGVSLTFTACFFGLLPGAFRRIANRIR
jgi:hypothetical protein